MYLRFTTPGVVTRARVAPGPFRAAYELWRSGDMRDPVVHAIGHEIDWFNQWLPVPSRFDVESKSRRWRDGVCWFRDDAREMVAHAYALAALIEDCGVPTERIWTRDPGQVLYRDPFQVVAKPERRMLAMRRRSPRRVSRPMARRLAGHSCSPVVQLRPHRGEAEAGDAVGLAAVAGDQPAPLQPAEQAERAIGEAMPVAGEAVGGDDPPGLVAQMADHAALRQRVKHALLVSGNVHWDWPLLACRCARPRHIQWRAGARLTRGTAPHRLSGRQSPAYSLRV